jgi:aminoglycoside 6-adenylyltransferase
MLGDTSMEYLIKQITSWGALHSDIRSLTIVGSRARLDRPADQWSDLDLILITTDPQPYLATGDWLGDIAPVRLTFLESTAVGNLVERRVLFDGAHDVDFTFVPMHLIQQMLHTGVPDEVAMVFRRGTRVVFDKDDLMQRVLDSLSPASPTVSLPTQAAFLEVVHDFLYHAMWTAKKLYRGELWVAKMCCDTYMKNLLLQMLEWHTHITKAEEQDIWHNGRFLEQWADPRVVADLKDAFAYYDRTDLHRALLKTLALFRWLANETAQKLAYDYPTPTHEYIVRWIEDQFAEESKTKPK